MAGVLSDWLQEGATLDEVGAGLDALSHDERVQAVQGLDRDGRRALYRLAGTDASLGESDFVPDDTGPLEQVVHQGWNSLPLPRSGRIFRKVFTRSERGRIVGYNDAPSGPLIGPGYFVVCLTPDLTTWRERGPYVIDYYQVPDEPVPGRWPAVRPNWVGLQVFVYDHTRDFMRRVSRHVTVGAAYKFDRALDNCFVLGRDGR